MIKVEVGQTLHLSDIPLPAGVEIPVLQQGPDHDLPIVSVNAPRGGSAEEEGEASE